MGMRRPKMNERHSCLQTRPLTPKPAAALVEMPAIDLLTALGWSFKNLYAETFGELGSEGRASESQVTLTRRLRAALVALNPGLPADA